MASITPSSSSAAFSPPSAHVSHLSHNRDLPDVPHSPVPLHERLAAIRQMSQSTYLILQHGPASPSLLETGKSPRLARTVPTSASAPSLASYAVDANTIIVASGSLEEGGLDALRQRMSPIEVQSVFLKFRGDIVFVQCIPDTASAVRRARAMVLGRSLLSQVPGGHAMVSMMINHPRQLTDPLIRSKVSAARASRNEKGLPVTHDSISPDADSLSSSGQFSADVPISVSSTSIPFTASGSLSTLDSYLMRSPLPAVGLGIGVGLNGLSPLRDAFDLNGNPATTVDTQEQQKTPNRLAFATLHPHVISPAQTSVDQFNATSSPHLTLSDGDEDTDAAQTLSASFPAPPQRTSVASQGAKAASRLGSSSGSNVPRLAPSHQAGHTGHSKTTGNAAVVGAGSSNQSGQTSIQAIRAQSVRHTPSLPSMLDSAPRRSISTRAASFSSSSIVTHDSVLLLAGPIDSETLDPDQERLEQERIDFIRWKAEQESMIIAKERERERNRRKADEAKREQVMRRLMIEQGAWQGGNGGAERPAGFGASDGGKSSSTGHDARLSYLGDAGSSVDSPATKTASLLPPPSVPPLQPPLSSTIADPRPSKPRVRRSPGLAPLHALPPLHPPPAAPLPKSPSTGKLSEGHSSSAGAHSVPAKKQTRSETVSTGSANDSVLSLTSRSPHRIDDRVKAAIEREMRRPVITLEGHVRPRVRQTRSRSRTTSEGVHRAYSPVSPLPDGDPLITSILEAQRKAKNQTQSENDEKATSISPVEPNEEPSQSVQSHSSVKLLNPDGRNVGSGWALAEVQGVQVGSPLDKDLPAAPEWAEEPQDGDDVSQGDQGHWSALYGVNRAHSTSESDERPAWKSTLDTLNGDQANELSTPRVEQVPVSPSLTLIDRIFKSKLLRSPKAATSDEEADMVTENGLTNDQFEAIRARQDVLDGLLTDLQRRRTLRTESEAVARARWARQQVRLQQLDAYERSRLESEERLRRARIAQQQEEEENRQRLLERERQQGLHRIEEEQERRKEAERAREIREGKLREAEKMQAELRQQIQEKQQERDRRRKSLRDAMIKRMEAGQVLTQGMISLQFGESQRWKRRWFELRKGFLCLFPETKALSSRPDEINAVETIAIRPDCIAALSDAFEEVQMPHAFLLRLHSGDDPVNDAATDELNQLCDVKTFLAHTDTDSIKERLMVGLALLAELHE